MFSEYFLWKTRDFEVINHVGMYIFCGTISKFKDETTMYEKLYIILKNIAPTSVSSEQAFSVAGSFVPNRRSRLSDESIDDLCFEKSYFDNNGY